MITEGPTQPDAQYFMNRFVSWEIASKANKWQGRNVTRWRNDEYDRLYRAADEEMDPVKRAAMFVRMNDLVIQNVVTVPVLWRNGVSASTPPPPRDGSVGLGVDVLAPAVLVPRRLVGTRQSEEKCPAARRRPITPRAPAAPELILRTWCAARDSTGHSTLSNLLRHPLAGSARDRASDGPAFFARLPDGCFYVRGPW
jgi:hypothetical protein